MEFNKKSILCNICLEYFTKSIIHVHCDTNQCHDCTKREAITLYKNRGIGFSSKNAIVDYLNLYYYTENI